MTSDGRAGAVRCAIVDAHGAGSLLPAALRRNGADVVFVHSPHPDDRLPRPPGELAPGIRHDGDVARTAAELARLGVTIVVAGAESGVLLADELSGALGTPGNGTRCPAARRDKSLMQAVVRDANLSAAVGFVSSSAAECAAWARDRGDWPVVVKPVASAGADNVLFCDGPSQVVAAHRQVVGDMDRYGRRNGTALVQQFLSGDEYYVNTVSRGGRHQIVETWRYRKRVVTGGRSINDFEDILPPDSPDARRIDGYVLAVLDALEIANGAAHTEVMLTERGPVLIECGARLGGGQMPEVLDRCVGGNQVDRLALSIADPDAFDRSSRTLAPRHRLRCVNLICLRDGVVPGAAGWAPIRGLDTFAAMTVSAPAGRPAPRTVDLATCPGAVYLAADDLARIEADCSRIREIEDTGLYD